MADRKRQTNRFNFRGLNTRLLADAIPILSGKSPAAINVRADGDSKVRTRSGYIIIQDSGAGAIKTDLRAYTTLGTDNNPRIISHDSSGGVWLDDGVKKGTVGTGGLGASLVPFRPNQSPQSWMYVCNATGYKKFQAPDASNNVTVQKVGIAEPQSPPDACPDGLQFNDFSAAAGSWSQSGTAGAPSDATRSTDTVIAIFQDPASVAPASKTRYTVQSNGTLQYSIGEVLTFNKSGGGTIKSVIEDIFPPINGGTALTIQSILYLGGLTGRCVFVPSQFQVGSNNQQQDPSGEPNPQLAFLPGQIAGLRRGSLINLGSEVVFVLSVTTGPQNQLAIECSTAVSHSAGETITGVLGIACSGLSNLVVGQTFTSAQINSAVTTGVGTLTQTLGTNPFNLALGTLGTPQEADHIHLSAAVDTPTNVIEIKLLFDIGDGSFTQNVLTYSINPSAFQLALNNSATQLTTVQTVAQQDLVNSQADSREQFATADVTSTDPSAPAMAATGVTQFTEIIIPISDLTRGGNDQTNTLAQCVKVQVVVNCSGNLNFYFGSLWVGGGGQPDIGDSVSSNSSAASAPYLYRVRPRSSLTGARGNPSPAIRYGVTPHRQQVILSLPSASYDSQIDTWDIERYGGTVVGDPTQPGFQAWRRVGIASASSATFVDNVFDDAALAGEPLDFDNFEPWPSVDVPYTATVGTGGVTAITVYGTAITVLGSTFPSTIANWLPGTLILLNGQTAYTLWTRPISIHGGYMFRTVETAGAPTVTTLQVNEPNVANQNLPYLWGPDSNGIIFGVGDRLRPGGLYSAKSNNPDSSPNNFYDLTQPGEPLMGGEVVDGLSLVASSKRWWQLQAAFATPQRWNPIETPAGRGLAAPWGHCTDGKFAYFWAKDGIYSMIPGLPAISLTETDLGNLFPSVDGLAGNNIVYAGYTFYAPDYSRVSQFRLSVANAILRAHYRDSTGTPRTITLDMSLDSTGNPRMAWASDAYADPIVNSYQVEQPTGTLLTAGTAYKQVYLCDRIGKIYAESDLSNDNGVPISCALATPEWDGGDSRVQDQWLDVWVDAIPISGLTTTPVTNGSAVGTPATIGATTVRTTPPAIVPMGNPIANSLAVVFSWIDNFNTQSAPTQLFEWSSEFIAQPVLIRTWKSVPTSHGLEGYHFAYRIRFAYLTKGANTVTLTLTAFDGTSPSPITLPATNGAYQKVEFVPTFNKGLLFTYQGTSSDQWAPIVEDCEIVVGQWNRSGPCSIFQGLGGIESV